jgi:hypothetical protein
MKYLATIRCIFDAEDELEARLDANEIVETVNSADILDEDDTMDVTQIIPYELQRAVEPAEMVNAMRNCRDMLIRTRITQCYDLARELDKTAWILEHRAEESFDLSGYDWGEMLLLTDRLLGRTHGVRGDSADHTDG